jgi:cytoskeletal protein CcmA (bactofilin family)
MAKTTDPNMEPIATTLGRETNFSGTMRFQRSLKIEGTFQGKIVSGGFLYIGEAAEVHADISVGSVVVGGMVRGNIEARERVELLPSARLYGDVRTAKLKIADGVVFDGKCEMIRNASEIDVFSARVAELKTSVESV